MKLELKHIAPYLPYSLKLWHKQWGTIVIMDVCWSDNNTFPIEDVEEYCKPILHPLSDLTKEEFKNKLIDFILEKGLYESKWAKGNDDYCAKIVNKPFGKLFKLQNHDEWVCLISFDEVDRCKAVIYNWLIENHFDVNNLIPKNLAIDINTI